MKKARKLYLPNISSKTKSTKNNSSQFVTENCFIQLVTNDNDIEMETYTTDEANEKPQMPTPIIIKTIIKDFLLLTEE